MYFFFAPERVFFHRCDEDDVSRDSVHLQVLAPEKFQAFETALSLSRGHIVSMALIQVCKYPEGLV